MLASCLYGFKKNNELKLTYNNNHSSPKYLGNTIVSFIKKNGLKKLNKICDKVQLVDGKSKPDYYQIIDLIDARMRYYYKGNKLNWDEIYLWNDGFLVYYKLGVYYIPNYSNTLDEIQDYLYIINLDDNKFEVYTDASNKTCTCEYKGYRLLNKYDIDSIPIGWDYDCSKLII